MIALRIDFLAGRFHANPWDRGTNDGDIDWPPSPWRVLRAITAGWYRAGAPNREEFAALLSHLSGAPRYRLPQAATGHTRHYMPLGTLKNGKLDTTLVIDSFITLERDREQICAAYVEWPDCTLTDGELKLLKACCALITYFGRAESWCSVAVLTSAPTSVDHLQLVDVAERSETGGPTVRRLGAGSSNGSALLASVSETTGEMRKNRRLLPSASRWIDYRLPVDFLMVREQYDRSERHHAVFPPTLLRFALERGRHTPQPSIKDALVFAELLRRSAMDRYSRLTGEVVTKRLAGKAEDGLPASGHEHPYYLPSDRTGRGFIDTVDVWFPKGCTHAEYTAVTSVPVLCERVIYEDDFPLTFIGVVDREDSKTWQSATPLVLDRFPKVRGTKDNRRSVDPPEQQISTMLARLGFPDADIDVWPSGRGIERERGGHFRIDAFRRSRIGKTEPQLPVVGVTLRFGSAVSGPIVVGRLSHFGLGRFEPVS